MKNDILIYDGSFEGFMTLIFHIYNKKLNPSEICSLGQAGLFAQSNITYTNHNYSQRVINGIVEKGGKKLFNFIYRCFLSELKNIEMELLYLIRKIFEGKSYIISDFGDEHIIYLHKVKKMISREVHRMHAFVRFQETKDNMWVCEINPDFNVLPLVGSHFVKRYPMQEWIIFDTRRQYGVHYNKSSGSSFITFDNDGNRLLNENVITEEETKYQALWKQYFHSVNIKERNNPKLHLQHVPRRYWKYLIEKQ